MTNHIETDQLIKRALSEDIGTGDITTLSVVPSQTIISGRFIVKKEGVICGLGLAARVFGLLDSRISLKELCHDGDYVNAGSLIATIHGPAASILTGERLALNFLQRLSGIATRTANLTKLVEGTNARIVDTRKTTPGLRVLEKYAVKQGGGYNHRMNLSDGILIKDNHIKAGGGIRQAIEAARKHAPATLKTEVEVESIDQLKEALQAGADIIMLDNMDLETMKQAVSMAKGKALLEASGNMDQKDLRQVALTGVDMISVGALTHSVMALDISLKLDDPETT